MLWNTKPQGGRRQHTTLRPFTRCLLCGYVAQHTPYNLCQRCCQQLPSLPNMCQRCGVETPAHQSECGSCIRHPPDIDLFAAAIPYCPPFDHFVTRWKLNSDQRYWPPLEYFVTAALATRHWPEFDAVVPIAMHPWRLVNRGFNQAEQVARVVAKNLATPVATRLLKKARHTTPQRRRNRADRLAGSGLQWSTTAAVRGKSILLVDDVYSTGATAGSAARALKQAGAKRVAAFVLARNF